jgi:hypothetical protein
LQHPVQVGESRITGKFGPVTRSSESLNLRIGMTDVRPQYLSLEWLAVSPQPACVTSTEGKYSSMMFATVGRLF